MKLLSSSIGALSMPHYERKVIVANRIKECRLNSGLSQRDIAKILHIGQATYCRMERAESEPSAVQLSTLSGLYGVSVLWLLGMPNYFVYADQSSPSSSSPRISAS
jgi:transcriptional regulator with XRE-family HTH domain